MRAFGYEIKVNWVELLKRIRGTLIRALIGAVCFLMFERQGLVLFFIAVTWEWLFNTAQQEVKVYKIKGLDRRKREELYRPEKKEGLISVNNRQKDSGTSRIAVRSSAYRFSHRTPSSLR